MRTATGAAVSAALTNRVTNGLRPYAYPATAAAYPTAAAHTHAATASALTTALTTAHAASASAHVASAYTAFGAPVLMSEAQQVAHLAAQQQFQEYQRTLALLQQEQQQEQQQQQQPPSSQQAAVDSRASDERDNQRDPAILLPAALVAGVAPNSQSATQLGVGWTGTPNLPPQPP